jgi:hypothetical protein
MSTRSNLIFPYVIYHLLERIILAEKILTLTTGIGRQVSSPAYCKKGGELQLGRELNLGVPGVKRAESVFRENPKIKQRIFQQYARSKQRSLFPLSLNFVVLPPLCKLLPVIQYQVIFLNDCIFQFIKLSFSAAKISDQIH